ncbi:MAG: dockerin type I domain-containing protein [Acutalibacteraceae bacterium]|nr:hypothetical protein [Clostridia bacterium]MEE3449487.1 dockerin type I domain-containing protein [Acutalibacteraceae bacterium]
MKKFISALLVFASIASMVSCAMISADAATIKGDINGDNQITLRDAALAQKINVGLVIPTDTQSYSGDMDNDGQVGASDSLIIQKYICLDNTTLENYSPNRIQRIKFYEKINADRVAANLEPFEISDSHLEAGNIRAKEYAESGGTNHNRPDGRSFITVLEECNLKENSSTTEYEYGATDYSSANDIYKKIQKSANDEESFYSKLMSPEYHTLCVGSVKNPQNSRLYYWVMVLD